VDGPQLVALGACDAPLVFGKKECAPPPVVVSFSGAACAPTITSLFSLGDSATPATKNAADPTTCTAAPLPNTTYNYFRIGSPLDPSRFAKLAGRLTGAGRLKLPVLATEGNELLAARPGSRQ